MNYPCHRTTCRHVSPWTNRKSTRPHIEPGRRLATYLSVLASVVVVGCSSASPASQPPVTTSPTVASTLAPIVTTQPPEPATTTTTLPSYETPLVGQCRGPLTEKISNDVTDERPPIECSSPHGLETFYVGTMAPSTTRYPVVDGTSETSDELTRQIRSECERRSDTYLGGARDDDIAIDSRARYFSFIPSVADFDAGARWFRCDVGIAPVGETATTINGTLARVLSATVLPLGGYDDGGRGIPSELVACEALNLDSTRRLVECSEPHVREAAMVKYNVFASMASYDAVTIEQIATEICDANIVTVEAPIANGKPLPGFVTIGALRRFPNEQGWADGERNVYCQAVGIDNQAYVGAWVSSDAVYVPTS
jgi:hypothetical protein